MQPVVIELAKLDHVHVNLGLTFHFFSSAVTRIGTGNNYLNIVILTQCHHPSRLNKLIRAFNENNKNNKTDKMNVKDEWLNKYNQDRYRSEEIKP